ASGWVLALIAGHAILAVIFPEETQREVFGQTGDFRAPHVGTTGGIASPTHDGYVVQGAWNYASGCDVSTHFIGRLASFDPATKASDGSSVFAIFDRSQYTVVDNWQAFGMHAT